MIFGDKDKFAIECYHEPIGNEKEWVFGRMCIWCSNNQLGDLNEPACMLNVTEGFLQTFMDSQNLYEGNELNDLDDRSLFNFLDEKLYIGDIGTMEQIQEDSEKYSKYDFLTNGGESFDPYKSFLVKNKNIFKLIFMDGIDIFYSGHIQDKYMIDIVNKFLNWIKEEKKANKEKF